MSVLSLLLISNWYFLHMDLLRIRKTLSVSGSWFIRLSSAFVFSDPEPQTINILYGWSGILGQFGLCFFISSFVYNQN